MDTSEYQSPLDRFLNCKANAELHAERGEHDYSARWYRLAASSAIRLLESMMSAEGIQNTKAAYKLVSECNKKTEESNVKEVKA